MELIENLLYIMLIVFVVGFIKKEFYIVFFVRNFLIEDKIVKINWNDIYVGVKLYYVCYFINFKFINLN